MIMYSNKINFPLKLSTQWQDFVRQALEKKPHLRPTAASLLEHPWIRSFNIPCVTFQTHLCLLTCCRTSEVRTWGLGGFRFQVLVLFLQNWMFGQATSWSPNFVGTSWCWAY